MPSLQPLSTLATAEQIARLRLIRSENVGPIGFRHLLARYGSAVRALEALPELARRGGGRSLRICSRAAAEREMEAVYAAGAEMLFLGHPPYPALLAHIEDAPPVLTVQGRVALAAGPGSPSSIAPSVAIVGARNASAAGLMFARQLAFDLAAAGVVVVSGLARGIDTAAHTGALAGGRGAGSGEGRAGEGGTIAAVAGGLNVIYPPENERLQRAIGAEGLLVAEQPWGAVPQARHFPRRNRIITGLGLGLVVVEATARSGSLISARLAGEQGRLLMAVPGSPLEPRAEGPNGLIRDGAILVQSAADVLEALEPLVRRGVSAPEVAYAPPLANLEPDGDARRAVAALLGLAPASVDSLIRETALPPAVVSIVLLELELAGRIVRHAGNRISLALPPDRAGQDNPATGTGLRVLI